jgi:hypothetical protein
MLQIGNQAVDLFLGVNRILLYCGNVLEEFDMSDLPAPGIVQVGSIHLVVPVPGRIREISNRFSGSVENLRYILF